LARLQNGGAPVSISQLSEEEHISSVFLEQIFFRLRKAGIVSSVRGPGGGFLFAREPDTLTLWEILEASGEELDVTGCDKHAKTCASTGIRCPSHSVWEDITKMIRNYLTQVTLARVLERAASSGTLPSTKTVPDPAELPQVP
jgi:Rrf2 family iron-sulfur cluster assembly transcriptional regulator